MFWNRANPGLGPGNIFFVYALFLAIDFVKNKIKNIITKYVTKQP